MDKYIKIFNEEKWSKDVKTKWEPPEGLFTKSGSEIAKTLLAASKDKAQAMQRLNFFINRTGKNLKPDQKTELEKAKKQISGS